MMREKTVLSCIQPTGSMHLGNYFGAIQNWVKLQENYDCFFGVVDYHAQTMPYTPKVLRENTLNMFIELLACGIDAEKSTLFVQSKVPEHAELGWILGCETSFGQLRRMTQFKEKSSRDDKDFSFVSAGLFNYPILQAADILIYNADYVPVGKDQEQHLELSRNIAQRFNTLYGDFFRIPQPLFSDVPKLKSLTNPQLKMSKSYGPAHYIGLFESEKDIKKKIMSAQTDSGNQQGTNSMSPGVENLFVLLKATGNYEEYDSFKEDYQNSKLKYGHLKTAVFNSITTMLAPMRERKLALENDLDNVKELMNKCSKKARVSAIKTLEEVKGLTGLYQSI